MSVLESYKHTMTCKPAIIEAYAWITYLFLTLSVMVKYADRHNSHATRPDSFVFMLSADDLSYTALLFIVISKCHFIVFGNTNQFPMYARLPELRNSKGLGESWSLTILFSFFARYFPFWLATAITLSVNDPEKGSLSISYLVQWPAVSVLRW